MQNYYEIGFQATRHDAFEIFNKCRLHNAKTIQKGSSEIYCAMKNNNQNGI